METIVVTTAYIAAQMLADIASLKIILFAGMSMDAGTLIYPITFTLRDLLHKIAGKKTCRVVIVAAGAVNLFMAIFFWIISKMPDAGVQSDWDSVLSPVWRIVFASIIAEVLAEMVDTEVYHWWVHNITKKFQWMRVLLSNGIGVPLDSIVFCWIAFGGVLPNSIVWSIFLANIILKGIVTIASLPLIYLVKDD